MTKFITVPNPILRKRSKPVNLPAGKAGKIDQKILKFIKELKNALIEAKEPPGVGLSAVQIGQLLRIFVARENVQAEPKVYINPKITWQSKEMTNGVPRRENKLEGCLSVPGYYGLIRRAKKIKLKYYTLTPKPYFDPPIGGEKQGSPTKVGGSYTLEEKTKVFSGFLATVIQHEMDHLNGILFIDRALEQGNQLYKLEKEGEKEILRGVEI